MIFPFILLRYILYLSYPIFKIKRTKESAYVSVGALYNACINFLNYVNDFFRYTFIKYNSIYLYYIS